MHAAVQNKVAKEIVVKSPIGATKCPSSPPVAPENAWRSSYFRKYDPELLTHALTDLSPAIKAVIQSTILKPYQITDAPVGLFYDLDLFDAHLEYLKHSFGPTVQHRIAVKSNPCTKLLNYAFETHNMGAECASIGEVLMAIRHCKIPPSHVVFDSPCKTKMELQWALKEKIFTNFDNFVEMDRAKVLIEKEDPELKKMMDEKKLGVCGLRINPLVGSGGGIQALCVSTEDSKFGIPVSQREELLKAYMDNPWMCSVHVHVGSGGMGSAILTAGIKTIVEFAKEVNSKAGYQQITDLDIGGGAPANYFSDTWGHKTQPNVPTFGEYASVLKSEVPELFSGEFKVITEFGQSIHAKCAFMLSQIEWMKGTEANPMAIVHFGAAECVRQIYGGSAHARRVEAYRSDGSRFEGPEAEAHYGQFTNGKFSVAGPLCFQGDFVAQGIGLPEDLGEGDWIAMKDAGANTLSFFSRHCSRLCPAIYGFRWSDENTVDDENLTLLKPREAMNSLSNFWGTGNTCN